LPQLSDFKTHPILFALETVLLASENGLGVLLKHAFYEMLRSPGFGMNQVDRCGDMTMREGDDSEGDAGEGAQANARMLSSADLLLLVSAREKLLAQWDEAVTMPRTFLAT
jgi:hypothetical protein